MTSRSSATTCGSRSRMSSSKRTRTVRRTTTRARTRRRSSTCWNAALALGGSVPERRSKHSGHRAAEAKSYEVAKRGSGKQQAATTMAFVRLLKDLMRDKKLRQAHRADHPGRGAHVRHGRVLPDREDLQPQGPELPVRGPGPRPGLQGIRAGPARSTPASTKPAPSQRSPPPAPPTPPTACRWSRSTCSTPCSASSAPATPSGPPPTR